VTTRLTRAAALLGIAVALTGCVRFTSDNTFSSHDTVSQDTIIAFEPSAAEQLGIDLTDFTADAMREQGATFPGIDPSKVAITDYSEGDLRGVRIVATDLTLDEINSVSSAGADQLGLGLGAPLTVTREDDDYVVRVSAGQGGELSQAVGSGQVALVANAVDVEVSVTFPGPVRSATAGEVNGKTVTLGLEDLLGSGDIEIRGQATDGIAWGPLLQWGGIVLVALLIVGGAAALIAQDLRARRRTNLAPLPPSDAKADADAAPAEPDTREE